MGYDRKYGQVTTEHDDIPDDEPVIVFRARDRFVPAMLGYYLAACERGGAGAPQGPGGRQYRGDRAVAA
jgi:hypothetical protein